LGGLGVGVFSWRVFCLGFSRGLLGFGLVGWWFCVFHVPLGILPLTLCSSPSFRAEIPQASHPQKLIAEEPFWPLLCGRRAFDFLCPERASLQFFCAGIESTPFLFWVLAEDASLLRFRPKSCLFPPSRVQQMRERLLDPGAGKGVSLPFRSRRTATFSVLF